jgi:hypothetical protein
VQAFWFGHDRSGAFPYCDDKSMQMTPGGRYLAGGVNQTARQASGDGQRSMLNINERPRSMGRPQSHISRP